jgi:hypothetical protein
MPELTFEDAQDLVRYIVLHPELQAQLRPVILSAELLDLPDLVRRNSEAIEQIGVRMDQLAVRVDQLGEQIRMLAERVDSLAAQIASLAVTAQAVVDSNRDFAIWQASASGDLLEIRLERRITGQLGSVMRRAQVVTVDRLEPVLDALDEGRITTLEWDSLVRADLIVVGRSKALGREIAVAVEASVTIDLHDLERAAERARILRACGYDAVGLVAGNEIRPEDEMRARESNIAVLLDGNLRIWPDAA